MLPLCPGRLSSTMRWPSTSPSLGEMMRIVVSVPPPGADGTMIRTGRSGYSAANTAGSTAHRQMKPGTALNGFTRILLVNSSRPHGRARPVAGDPPEHQAGDQACARRGVEIKDPAHHFTPRVQPLNRAVAQAQYLPGFVVDRQPAQEEGDA